MRAATYGRGAWIMLGELGTTRRIASAGFDWICLDEQHGAVDDGTLLRLAQDLRSEPAALAVRVPANDAAAIGRAADLGAAIVIVPMIDDRASARRAVSALAYPPVGGRSWGPLTPLWGVAAPAARSAELTVQLWVMIETRGAMEQLEAILAVDGVSGAFVGPYDLAIALGVEFDDLIAADGEMAPLRRITTACDRAGIVAGAFAGNPTTAARLAGLGFGQLAVTTDVGIVDAGIDATLPGSAPRIGGY